MNQPLHTRPFREQKPATKVTIAVMVSLMLCGCSTALALAWRAIDWALS